MIEESGPPNDPRDVEKPDEVGASPTTDEMEPRRRPSTSNRYAKQIVREIKRDGAFIFVSTHPIKQILKWGGCDGVEVSNQDIDDHKRIIAENREAIKEILAHIHDNWLYPALRNLGLNSYERLSQDVSRWKEANMMAKGAGAEPVILETVFSGINMWGTGRPADYPEIMDLQIETFINYPEMYSSIEELLKHGFAMIINQISQYVIAELNSCRQADKNSDEWLMGKIIDTYIMYRNIHELGFAGLRISRPGDRLIHEGMGTANKVSQQVSELSFEISEENRARFLRELIIRLAKTSIAFITNKEVEELSTHASGQAGQLTKKLDYIPDWVINAHADMPSVSDYKRVVFVHSLISAGGLSNFQPDNPDQFIVEYKYILDSIENARGCPFTGNMITYLIKQIIELHKLVDEYEKYTRNPNAYVESLYAKRAQTISAKEEEE